MKTLYLLRHAETIWNQDGKLQGRQNIHLSLRGISQAKKAKKNVDKLDIDVVYSSPLIRALETAKYVVKDRDLEIRIHDDLIERDFGSFEGLEIGQLDKLKSINEAKQFDGESTEEAAKRMKKALLDIVDKCEYDNILIAGHGGLIGYFLEMTYKELDNGEAFDYHHLENCSINVIKYDEDKKIFIPTGEYIRCI